MTAERTLRRIAVLSLVSGIVWGLTRSPADALGEVTPAMIGAAVAVLCVGASNVLRARRRRRRAGVLRGLIQ